MEYQNENFNGIYDFRCGFHNGWLINQHIHEYSEFLYCKNGACEVIVNGKSIRLTEKQLVWIPPNYIHQYSCPDAQVICAVFSNDFIPLFFQITKKKMMIPEPVNMSDMSDILDNFYTLSRENIMCLNAYLNLICSKVVEHASFESAKQTDGILYQKVISYIASHFTEEISLKSLAKKFDYNEKYLSYSLHALTNVHFTTLLSMYRIENAKKLLMQNPPMSISAIALSSGFSAINTFNRTFKKISGMTPTDFRNVYFKKYVHP